jgi:deazaflavin-dependent oxidoreductase (nitroreductase family)
VSHDRARSWEARGCAESALRVVHGHGNSIPLTDFSTGNRIVDLDWIMTRLNPVVAFVLRSPFHYPFSLGLMLLTVTGRRSGHRYTIPVGYQRRDEGILVLVSKARRKRWWRNYMDPGPVELRVRGRTVGGEARCVPRGSEEFREALDSTFRRHPTLGRQFGVSYDRRIGLTPLQQEKLAEDAAVVKIKVTAAPRRSS